MGAATILLAATAARGAPDGQALFAQNCAACHQATGKGIPGAFPALAGDKLVNGPPGPVISTVLKGRGGMPHFGDQLDDATIASVLSYVRAAWGNAASPIAPGQVATLRAGGSPVVTETGGMQAH